MCLCKGTRQVTLLDLYDCVVPVTRMGPGSISKCYGKRLLSFVPRKLFDD